MASMFSLIRLFFIMSGFISLLIRRIVHQGSRVDLTLLHLLKWMPPTSGGVFALTKSVLRILDKMMDWVEANVTQ